VAEKATFIDIGALWRRDSGKSRASGLLDLAEVEKLLRALPDENKARIFLSDNKSSHERAPDFRITAVYGGEDYRQKKEGSRGGRDSSRRERRDRDEQTRLFQGARDDDEEVPF